MIPSRPIFSAFALLASSAFHFGNVAAQTHGLTDCQPLVKDCPPNKAFGMAHNWNFNTTPAGWETKVRPVTYDNNNGASFTITKQGESPTIRSTYYIFFGRVEIIAKAAPGVGMISSMMLLSDDLDEIDWEFLGINSTHALTNYFGKGIEDFTKGEYYPVKGGVQADFHNYTTLWTKDRLDWIIDGQIVRTLLPKDANNTYNYPQTPMRLSMGIWASSDPRLPKGTQEWGGGASDFSKGPFSMNVKSTYIEDFSTGKEYVYGDRSGTYQSIKVVAGESTANSTLTAAQVQDKSVSDRWNELSSGAKTGVYVGSAAFVALIAGSLLFYFLRQRKRGQEESRLAAEREERERVELEQYRKAGINPDSLVQQTEYNAKDRDDMGSRGGGNSIDGQAVIPGSPLNEKSWGAPMAAAAIGGAAGGAAAANGMRSPSAPLLRDGPSSPGHNNGFNGQYYDEQPGQYDQQQQQQQQYGRDLGPQGGMRSSPGPAGMARAPSPGAPPAFPPPQGPPSPAAYGSNGRSYTTPAERMGSPGPMNGPQRSYTNDPYQGHGDGQHGGGSQQWR
ncbi:extracellular cell wall glucanase Crf1 [Magnaporthiopsis poae ATCC 64411]|uniref:chitinase n=1 Tax=Magnaporthiopsis poae (strain ATCC 64411 / 73-15) TaxID=644358 RepID=A0A0C4DQF0_MAGP6|nr:extracellular cell wall glucanase Crf1 [Magnaporthiopsis poae ATCC 64411]